MVKQRWWGCVGHEMNQGERCVYSKSRKQRWSQIDGRWKRWRGSVYKRSDAAQSVLVMTQLTPHIATNPSSSCFPSLLSRLPLSLAPSLRLCDAVKIYSCNWLPIVYHTGLQIMTNLELSCHLPSWFWFSLTLIDTAVVVLHFSGAFFFFFLHWNVGVCRASTVPRPANCSASHYELSHAAQCWDSPSQAEARSDPPWSGLLWNLANCIQSVMVSFLSVIKMCCEYPLMSCRTKKKTLLKVACTSVVWWAVRWRPLSFAFPFLSPPTGLFFCQLCCVIKQHSKNIGGEIEFVYSHNFIM